MGWGVKGYARDGRGRGLVGLEGLFSTPHLFGRREVLAE